MRIFTFGIAFHFFVAGNRRHFKFGMRFEHSNSQPTNDKLSLKWVWPRHVTHFKFSSPTISLERLKLETLNLLCMLIMASPSLWTTNCPRKGRGHCHVTCLVFWKISDNISKTVRDSLIVSIKFELEVVCALSNGYIADDLGWPLSTLNLLNFYVLHCLMHLNWWTDCKDYKFDVQVECASYSLQKLSLIGSGLWTIYKILGLQSWYHWNGGT